MSCTETKKLTRENHPNIAKGTDDTEAQPCQPVLGIQHILDEIMRCVEFNDLFNCRLVCTFWNVTVAPIIQQQFTLYLQGYCNFYGYRSSRKLLATHPLQNHAPNTRSHNSSGRFRPVKSLDDWVKLLESSRKLNLAQYFPCRKFEFFDQSQGSSMRNLQDAVLQRFLDTFGIYLDELSICFDFPLTIEENPYFRSYNVLHENDAMKLIENLLTVQAPSLSFLSLQFPTHVSWEVDGASRGNLSSLRSTDPEFQNICQNLERKKNSKLKFLHWTKQVSAKVLEVILQLAPQLQSVVLQTGYEHVLTEPLKRVHLLRSVDINPRYGSIQSLETLAATFRHANLFLRNIYIRFCHCSVCVEREIWTEKLQWKIIRVINAILKATHSPSLKSIDWFGRSEGVRTQINFKNVAPTICKFRLWDPLYPLDLNQPSPKEQLPFRIHT